MTRFLFFFIVFLLNAEFNLTLAQIDGGHAYLMGDYVNVAIDSAKGREGTETIGAGFNQRAPGARCGFVADPDDSGWDLSLFHGDFFMAGTPENGFGLEIAGAEYSNNYDLFQIPPIAPISHELDGSCILVDWRGSVAGVEMHVRYRLMTGELYYTTEVTLINTTGSMLTELYYYRNFDPDNNQTLSGSYVTENTIVSQPDSSCRKALVSATQDAPFDSYVGLGAIGTNFRVSHGGFSNRDASNIWNGTGGLEGTEGAVEVADQSISLAYKTDLPAGDSVTFSYAVIMSESALDEAFNQNYHLNYLMEDGTTGLPWVSCEDATTDTLSICAGQEVLLFLEGDIVSDYEWTWSPDEWLSETEGDSTYASPEASTTYTVTPYIGDCYSLLPREIVILTTTGVPGATISDDVTIELGETTTLVATGGDSYEWSPIESLSDPYSAITEASPSETTVYFVDISLDSAECSSTLGVVVTVIDPSGITEEKVEQTVKAFPNPFNETTTISFEPELIESHLLVVHDALGRVVYKNNVTGNQVTLSREELSPGIFFVSVFNKDQVELVTFKLVVE